MEEEKTKICFKCGRKLPLSEFCKKNGIKLLEIPYNRFDDIELILGKKIKKK